MDACPLCFAGILLLLLLAIWYVKSRGEARRVHEVNRAIGELTQAAERVHGCLDKARSDELGPSPALERAVDALRRVRAANTHSEARKNAETIKSHVLNANSLLVVANMPVERALAAMPGAYEDFMRHAKVLRAKTDQFFRTAAVCDC